MEATAANGAGLTSVAHTVDERRLRAFAAGVGDISAPLFDLDSPDGIVAHPVFPVVLEWPHVVAGPPGLGLDDEAVHAGLHVSHEISWHRPIRPGDSLRTTGRVETLEQRSIGIHVVFVFVTTGTDGEPVVESRQGVLYRGSTLPAAAAASTGDVPTTRAPRSSDHSPPHEALDDVATFRVEEADATVYSECSGIWNPIHTDPRAARAAGLPRPVLHGTATLARTVSALVETRLEGDPTRITRLACRFTAPISPDDRATVSASQLRRLPGAAQALTFTARRDDGTPILDEGLIEISAR
ncbi:MAG TPA: MaoC/PaaZ C-terminal domain-containing protein [Solirubrobacterales bacterium]|nr:MaoC/PaaZ C-terminal domain-containing protein [Solirubrobacterales bacterium]